MRFFSPTLLALVAIFCITCGYVKVAGSDQAIICAMQYALCTSAKCVPDPDDADKTICFCDVLEGKSLGHTSCDQRVSYTDSSGARHITSTFSLEQFATLKNMTCPSGTPWSDCLDQPCTVDPQDSTKAICMCKLVRTGDWQTFGGDCDESTCDTGYWSGATADGNKTNVAFLVKALGLEESPEKFCRE